MIENKAIVTDGSASNNLVGGEGEVQFTVSITRKATGKTETYKMVGKVGPGLPTPDASGPKPLGDSNGSNALDSGT